MTLREIREAYDSNYREMLAVIDQMGGELQIDFHRRKRTALYLRLRQLQQREHELDRMESRLVEDKVIME